MTFGLCRPRCLVASFAAENRNEELDDLEQAARPTVAGWFLDEIIQAATHRSNVPGPGAADLEIDDHISGLSEEEAPLVPVSNCAPFSASLLLTLFRS